MSSSLHTNYSYEHAPSLIPVFPVVGRNARERRRIRRANERLQKAMEAGAVPTTWGPVPTTAQNLPLCTPGASTSYTAPFQPQPVTTTYYTQETSQVYQPPQQSRRPQITRIDLLWGNVQDPSTSGFPSAFSTPGRVKVIEEQSCPWMPSSALLLGLNDPEVDNLDDLERIMDVRKIGTTLNSSPRSLTGSLDTIAESDETSSTMSSPSSSGLSSLPATPPDVSIALPPLKGSSLIPFYLELPSDLISPLEI